MFTGLIQTLGTVTQFKPRGQDCRMRIEGVALSNLLEGESIALNGVCLTARDCEANAFWADLSAATLSITALEDLQVGYAVNLERSLTLATRLGGHLVSGHIDGVGTCERVEDQGRSRRLVFSVPAGLARYIAVKGSICVDGVSLTVNGFDAEGFDVNVIPHTLRNTNLRHLTAGSRVNIEVDLLARYLERLLQQTLPDELDPSGRLRDLLGRDMPRGSE